ncbi:hypothetical protein H2203_004958 [Taxawa tesnikishii (nom. ined.)]|nr:hypothetical protein H2203_004958 [Dothideales sp. JES 119]
MSPGRTDLDGTYDYIVCGGGTSGCVVAARLAIDTDTRVLLIEAGAHNKDLENVHMVGGWSKNFDSPEDWNIVTEPMKGVNNRQVKVSRGRFLGGSSGVNGTLCIRGSKQDYDDWNLPGWSGEEFFGYMRKAETFHGKSWFKEAPGIHGTDGPLHVEPHDLAPISEKLLEDRTRLRSCSADSIPGLRTTGADYVTNENHRDNIDILVDTVVDKVNLEDVEGDLRAVSVDVVGKDGSKRTLYARKEIIVSGGAYCSPPILLRSGIGPKEELEKLGIACLVDSPGVGKNLLDHLIVFAFYETDKVGLTTDHLVYHDNALMSTYEQWKKEKTGFLSTFPFGAFAYARLDDRLQEEPLWKNASRQPGRDPMGLTPKQPNVEYFTTECYGGPKQYIDYPVDHKHVFSMITELFSPRSKGSVTLSSRDPLANPVVDHNYLSDPLDLLVLSEGVRLGNEIVTRGAGTRDLVKGSWPSNLTHHTHTNREDWVPYVKQHATTCYHAAGTCRMGREGDGEAVLDEKLRVRGVKGLRVADCSVMPTLNGGHTQMPAYGIGEKCADMVIAENRVGGRC